MPMAGCHKSRGKYIVTGGGEHTNIYILSARKICESKGLPVYLQHIRRTSTKQTREFYRVEYAGKGHYFDTENEAIEYMKRRKFI